MPLSLQLALSKQK